MKRYHGSRTLLNLPGHHATAAIVAEIENTSKWKKGKNGDGNDANSWNIRPDFSLAISDCTRVINLDLELDNEDSIRNSVHKLDTMIDALTKFRAGFVLEAARFNDRKEGLSE